MRQLTLKQKLFCQNYIENRGNGTQAVIDAGYNVSKAGLIDRKQAKVIASQNLAKKPIQEYLQEQYAKEFPMDVLAHREHANLIMQRENLNATAKAIDMYYKITGVYKSATCKKCRESRAHSLNDQLTRLASLLPD